MITDAGLLRAYSPGGDHPSGANVDGTHIYGLEVHMVGAGAYDG